MTGQSELSASFRSALILSPQCPPVFEFLADVLHTKLGWSQPAVNQCLQGDWNEQWSAGQRVEGRNRRHWKRKRGKWNRRRRHLRLVIPAHYLLTATTDGVGVVLTYPQLTDYFSSNVLSPPYLD
ncbi:hypothetical protein BO82DRAFT_108637 [Aspergillus uvarum CBS 121591]|uniref:Uncharacterized protein n=1 Tax=Aspergillus uvarum CBS 121591 TaxID=1448315 RepID=A0A319C9H5_9EURO|nr:hypothetical protein BO82DRAFT_108637 [Aspergillus uvarum CBS 121591]PYH80337.1 hypothetical protein BO82DRAFT_108637 [Aspergillus uvarum CBS 121591]